MRPFHSALLAATLALGAIPTLAQDVDPYGFNRQGFIRNAVGDQCWYVQTYEKTNPHFTPSKSHMTNQRLRTIRFDDPECMADTLDGLDAAVVINKSMIARTISGWYVGSYVTDDTRYEPSKRRQPAGIMQDHGECIMAPGLPATAIAVDFVSDGDSITEVLYAPTYDCGEPL